MSTVSYCPWFDVADRQRLPFFAQPEGTGATNANDVLAALGVRVGERAAPNCCRSL